MRFASILLALAIAARPAAADCLSDADVNTKVADVFAANEASLAKQLAKQKLTKLSLPRHRAHDRGEPRAKINDVTTVDGVRVVYFGQFMECALDPFEFVQQGSKIYKLERQPKYGPPRVQACECHFAGFRCGGAVPPRVALYYELPADTTYAGTMAVAYDAQNPTVVNTRTDCRPPAPPP